MLLFSNLCWLWDSCLTSHTLQNSKLSSGKASDICLQILDSTDEGHNNHRLVFIQCLLVWFQNESSCLNRLLDWDSSEATLSQMKAFSVWNRPDVTAQEWIFSMIQFVPLYFIYDVMCLKTCCYHFTTSPGNLKLIHMFILAWVTDITQLFPL